MTRDLKRNQQDSREEQPLVSIVTPSYNQGQFIEQTILSVKNQNCPNIEHIIVDGGSTDNTLEILKKYEGTYNMCWISESDEGQADAVNKGFEMANGEIIGWLNSDDVYVDRHAITSMVNVLQNSEDVDVVYGDLIFINADSVILKIQRYPPFNYRCMLRKNYIGQPTAFFRKRIVEKHKLDISLQFAMDYEFWLRLGEKYKFLHIDRIVAGERNHPQRKVVTHRAQVGKESFEVKKRYGQTFGLQYYIGRFVDMFPSNEIGRIKGLYKLPYLYKKNDFAFQASLGPISTVVANQLWRRTRNIGLQQS